MNTAEQRLAYWINHRWNILVKRERGDPKPWTTDRILQDFRFCNVHRENDKVTRWIAANWRDPHLNSPHLVPALVLARMFNLPETLQALGFPHFWDIEDMADGLKDRRACGLKIFNGAYLITTCCVKMDKIDYVFRVADDTHAIFSKPQLIDNTLEAYHRRLTSVKGLGSFLAAQVIADLKNIPGHPLQHALDWSTWCAPGPGSLRGLARLEGGRRPSKKAFLGVAQAARQRVVPLLDPMPDIDMQDFQNCLCEFDKWERTYFGESKPKQRYDGRHPDSTNPIP